MKKARVMVVEDEGLVAVQIKEGLENLGYEVPVMALSGKEAIEGAVATEIDLVVMDIKLKGGMDGIEAAKRICSMMDIPVVYMTAYSDEETLQRARMTEPFGYILKPFEERSLHATIQMALKKSKRQRKLKEKEEWLSAILKGIAGAVIISDLKGIVKFINPAAEILTKWKQAQAFGKRLSEVFRILDSKTRSTAIIPVSTPVLEGRVAFRENYILVARDDTEIPIDYSLAPLRSEKRSVFGIILLFRDVTERQKSQEIIQRELEETTRIQRRSLPEKEASISRIRINWLFHPSVFGSGDIFNFFSLDGSHVGFFLLDVMGHGFTAALFSMMLNQFLSPNIDQSGILLKPGEADHAFYVLSPSEVIEELNKRFHFERNDNPFFTIVYGITDTDTGITRIARAGHTYPIHQKGGGETLQIKSEGDAVGPFPEISVEEVEFVFEKGDRLFLYSDGLIDCADKDMERFSAERLIDLLKENKKNSLKELIETLDWEIMKWRSKDQFDDDISLLAMERE